MVLLTGASVVAAAISVAVARSARDEANRANLLSTAANSIARDANRLAEDSNTVASGAAASAAEANRLSSESNSIARDAAGSAAEANRISSESNSIAREAVDAARSAPIEVAWDEALVAVAALQSANPAHPKEQVGALLTALRTRTFLLIDRLGWDGFGEWIAQEQRRGVLLMREVHAKAAVLAQRTGRLTVDQTMDVNEEFWKWVVAYTQNLRRFRQVGPEPEMFGRLATIARTEWQGVCTRNGWPEEPEAVPGLVPLDEPDR